MHSVMYLPECERTGAHEAADIINSRRRGILDNLLESYSHNGGGSDRVIGRDQQEGSNANGSGPLLQSAIARRHQGVETGALPLSWREKASSLDKESLLGVLEEALATICELRKHQYDAPNFRTSAPGRNTSGDYDLPRGQQLDLERKNQASNSSPVVAVSASDGNDRDDHNHNAAKNNTQTPRRGGVLPTVISDSSRQKDCCNGTFGALSHQKGPPSPSSGIGNVMAPSPPRGDQRQSPSPNSTLDMLNRVGEQGGKVGVLMVAQKSGSSFRRAFSNGRGQLSSSSTAGNLPLSEPQVKLSADGIDEDPKANGGGRGVSLENTALRGSACEGILLDRELARQSQRRDCTSTTVFGRCGSLFSLGEVPHVVSETDVLIESMRQQSLTRAHENQDNNNTFAVEGRRLPQCLPISPRFISRTSSSSSGASSMHGGSASIVRGRGGGMLHEDALYRGGACEGPLGEVDRRNSEGSSSSSCGIAAPLTTHARTRTSSTAEGSMLGSRSHDASDDAESDGDHASSSYGDDEHPLTVARRVVSASVPIIGFGYGGGVGGSVACAAPPPPAISYGGAGEGVFKSRSFSYRAPSMPVSGMDSTSSLRYRIGDNTTAFPFPPPPRFSSPRPVLTPVDGAGSPAMSPTRFLVGTFRGGTTAVPSSASSGMLSTSPAGNHGHNFSGGSVLAKKEAVQPAASALRSPKNQLAYARSGAQEDLTMEEGFGLAKPESPKDVDLIYNNNSQQGGAKCTVAPPVLQVANNDPSTSDTLFALSSIKRVPTTAIPPGAKSSLVYVPLRLLHFYQDYVCNRFIDSRSIRQTIDELREGRRLTEKDAGACGRGGGGFVGNAASAGSSSVTSERSLPSNESLPCPRVENLIRASDLPRSPQKQTALPSGGSDFVESLSNKGDASASAAAALLRVHTTTSSLRTESEEENTLFFKNLSVNSPLAAGFVPLFSSTRTSDIFVESPAFGSHGVSHSEHVTTTGNGRPIVNTNNVWTSASRNESASEKASTSPANPRTCTSVFLGGSANVNVQPAKVVAHTPYSLPIMDAMFWRGKWYGMGNRRLTCYHFVYADSPDTLIPVLGTYVSDEDQLQPQGNGIGVRVGGGLFIDGHCYFTMGHCLHTAIMRRGMVLSSPPSNTRSFSTPRGNTSARESEGLSSRD